MVFQNRQEAGKRLAAELIKFRKEKPFVLSLPRGGVPIGYEIAKVLHAPLLPIVVRKIGLSGNKEFGIGAIAENEVEVLDTTTINVMGIDEGEIRDAIELEEEELRRRVRLYREDQPLPDLTDRMAILVDDGMATGITARAAIQSVKKLHPKKIVLASPVCALDTVEGIKSQVDEVICLVTPVEFTAVGLWYRDFKQVSDEEVVNLLKGSQKKE